MSRKAENRKIREISEGNFHSINASNKAEKFKFSKLSQGIDSWRNAQAQQFRKEERELWKTLDKISIEKSKHLSEEEQYFCDYSPGDGIAMISLCDLDNESDQHEVSEDESCLPEEKEKDIGPSIDGSVGAAVKENDADQDKHELKNRRINSLNDLKASLSSRRNSLIKKETSHTQRGRGSFYGPQRGSFHGSERGSFHGSERGINQKANHNRRRSSIEPEEITPFYMKKKYEHQVANANRPWTDATMQRFTRRRNALTLEDEQNLREWQAKAPSADLGTITFKTSNTDRAWLSTDVRKEREKAIRRQSTTNMENAYQHRPSSGLRRISMALERMPSEESLKAANQTPRSKKSINHSPRPRQSSGVKSLSEIRKISLPNSCDASKEKLHLSTHRRHTVGEIFNHDALLRKKHLPDLKELKNFQDLDCSTELVSFDDKGVVFPAYEKDREYNLKEFISLRKCRYLRLSKLNWESLQWQSKHQALLDY